ncbi:unnamed protein product [Lymnaea stagnalis]|uniref:Uncharacterized protein n=1 Tax=Lymnaea stagnalis TaxID=6523 RepID=A0AAV2HLK7_LYMST
MTESLTACLLVFVTITCFSETITGASVETHFCQNTTAEVNATSWPQNDSRILLALTVDTDPPHKVLTQISFGISLYTIFFQCITNPNNSICSAHYHNNSVTEIESSETPSLNYTNRGQKFRCLLNTNTSILECFRENDVNAGKNLFMIIKENKTVDTATTYSPLVALDSQQAIVHILCIEEHEISCDCFADVIDEYYFTPNQGNHTNQGVKMISSPGIWLTFSAFFMSLYTL